MQRSTLTTVLASLGLACAPERGEVVEPEVAPQAEPPIVPEPSGLSGAAKPPAPSLPKPKPSDPHFEGVPTKVCSARIQQRDEPLLRTESFLAAWQELAPVIRDPHAQSIPTTEIDTRFAICKTEQCSIGTEPRLVEIVVDDRVSTGALIPSEGGMLVVPELASEHTVGEHTNEIQLEAERHGRFVHVWAIIYEWREEYVSYGDYEDAGRELARISRTIRRDLVIDEVDGELELVVEQSPSRPDAKPRVELEFEQGNLVLRGCESALELQWTE
jgi:hypothetical protein